MALLGTDQLHHLGWRDDRENGSNLFRGFSTISLKPDPGQRERNWFFARRFHLISLGTCKRIEPIYFSFPPTKVGLDYRFYFSFKSTDRHFAVLASSRSIGNIGELKNSAHFRIWIVPSTFPTISAGIWDTERCGMAPVSTSSSATKYRFLSCSSKYC